MNKTILAALAAISMAVSGPALAASKKEESCMHQAAVVAAVQQGQPPVQDARWGLASLEVCHGIIQSSENGKEISLERQVPVRSINERKQRK